MEIGKKLLPICTYSINVHCHKEGCEALGISVWTSLYFIYVWPFTKKTCGLLVHVCITVYCIQSAVDRQAWAGSVDLKNNNNKLRTQPVQVGVSKDSCCKYTGCLECGWSVIKKAVY